MGRVVLRAQCLNCARQMWAAGYAQAAVDITAEIDRQMDVGDLAEALDQTDDPLAGILFRLMLRVLRDTVPPRAPGDIGADCCTPLDQTHAPSGYEGPEGGELGGHVYHCIRTRRRRATRPCSPQLLPGSDPRSAKR
jgi:hypothetical protein